VLQGPVPATTLETAPSRLLHAEAVTLAADQPPRRHPMTLTGLIIFLLIGAIAGWLAGLIVRGFGFGLLGNILFVIIGEFIAGWLLPALGIGFSVGSPIVTSIVYAIIGAVVLLVIIGLIKRA
jgi:uncharacterized membrane protein YeaQ/YmgE (transglycosylase-associated protein family)